MIKCNNNNRIQSYIINGAKMDLPKELDSIIRRVKTRAEREIPDTGYFRSFSENLEKGNTPDFFAKDVALFIERDEERDGCAYLGVSVLHPQLSLDSSTYLMNGDRTKIIAYLDNPEFKVKLQDKILELSESLKDVR